MSLLERVKTSSQENLTQYSSVNQRLKDLLLRNLEDKISAEEMVALSFKDRSLAECEVRNICEEYFRETFLRDLAILQEHENISWADVGDEDKYKAIDWVIDSVFGLGVLEQLIQDESVSEIMINGPAHLFYEKQGILYEKKSPFRDDEEVRALIDRIVGPLGRRIDESSPMVNARLVQGHRVHAIIPPLALDGPVLTIRKFKQHLMTLGDYIDNGSMEESVAQFLKWAVLSRKNIAVTGGTGSGKTTLLNSLSNEINLKERIITIEDSAELRFETHPHVVRLEARPRNSEGVGEVSIRDLVISSLRMRPDRIVVGECRGGEALDMLQAMNTGHDGSLTTLHANSPYEVIMRLVSMVRYAADLPVDVIEEQIASALNLIVQTVRLPSGKRIVCELAEFSYDTEKRRCQCLSLYSYQPDQGKGVWFSVPSWIENLEQKGIASCEEVMLWKQSLCL